VLFYSLIVLILSICLMWYAIRAAVMNPALRPQLVGTPGRMVVLNLIRLLTTAVGVTGVWYSSGWVAGVLTYVVTELVRWRLPRVYTATAIRDLTTNLLQWQPGLEPKTAQEAAAESVQAWIQGQN
jgi:hypothetical protein